MSRIMIEDMTALLDDMFMKAITPDGDRTMENALHFIIFIMSRDRYDQLRAIENGIMIRNYLVGVIGLITEPALPGHEGAPGDVILVLGDANFVDFFPCHS